MQMKGQGKVYIIEQTIGKCGRPLLYGMGQNKVNESFDLAGTRA
jgi:hypothetical protein